MPADFGLSKIVSSEVTMQTVCGTPGYVGKFVSDAPLVQRMDFETFCPLSVQLLKCCLARSMEAR